MAGFLCLLAIVAVNTLVDMRTRYTFLVLHVDIPWVILKCQHQFEFAPANQVMLQGIYRILKSDGVYLAQDIHSSSYHHGDIEHPMGSLLYPISIMHCMTVSLAQGHEGLGKMWGRERARDYFSRAGFRSIDVHQLPHDNQNDYRVLRP